MWGERGGEKRFRGGRVSRSLRWRTRGRSRAPSRWMRAALSSTPRGRATAPGKPARREHEYKRNGTQCLFAALKVHHGEVIGMASKTRNRWDLIQFLNQLDAALPIVE